MSAKRDDASGQNWDQLMAAAQIAPWADAGCTWWLETRWEMPHDSPQRMHEITDMILERMEDPLRPGPWDRRGMVVGDVQSGKTSNYSGLICKAADSGYSAIIILAGMHNKMTQ